MSVFTNSYQRMGKTTDELTKFILIKIMTSDNNRAPMMGRRKDGYEGITYKNFFTRMSF